MNETIFLGANLEPVTPKAGQWFCEVTYDASQEGYEIALVEFIGWIDGTGYVVSDGDDTRRPSGDVMILRNI